MERSSGVIAGLFAALIMAGAVAWSAMTLGQAIVDQRVVDRRVTVKGLAERDVKADLAVWPLTITAANDDLADLQEKIDADVALVRAFLTERGFDVAEISLGRLQVQDRVAQGYGQDFQRGGRYVITQPMVVRSENVDRVAQVSRGLGELVRQGVVLQDWQGPAYVFTGLNGIKPQMIADATANAREAAIQFAQDAGTQLGPIANANQGVFVILPRDDIPGEIESNQIFKTVRVVSTVTYLLEAQT
ncbi:MAG: SIMPL domain-containing protein [Maricaulaceae bacterium]